MENNKVMLINAVPAAAHLREVVNFNPKKFLQRGADPETGEVRMQMQLRYKKLWFRLAFPNGSMNYRPIRVTDRTATYEAAVYLDRNDERPISAFTVTRSKEDVADGDFVKAAQEAALDTAQSLNRRPQPPPIPLHRLSLPKREHRHHLLSIRRKTHRRRRSPARRVRVTMERSSTKPEMQMLNTKTPNLPPHRTPEALLRP